MYDIGDFNFRNEIKDSFKLIMFRKLINKKFITLKIPEGEKIHKDEDILDLINIIGILNTIKKTKPKFNCYLFARIFQFA